jgi:hypothetical protein
MTRFAIAVLFVAVPAFAADPPKPEDAKKAAEEMGTWVVKGEHEKGPDYIYEPLLKLLGGREAVVKKAKADRQQSEAKGIVTEAYTPGDPGEPLTEGENTFVVVPATMKLSGKEGVLILHLTLLGISPDGGKTWKFADVSRFKEDRKGMEAILPKLPAKLELPDPKPPEWVKDAAVPPKPEEAKKAAKKTAEGIGEAFLKGDFAAVFDHTYEPAVKALGGKEAAVKRVTDGVKEMEAGGFKFKAYTVGDPGDVHAEGDNTFVVVPTTLEMTTPEGKSIQKGYLLGISPDGGRTWKFADGAGLKDKKARDLLLPKLPAKLELPEYKEPEFVKEK